MGAFKISDAEILAKRSPKGGWTRQQLAEWGVPWPPPKGWRKALTGGARSAPKTTVASGWVPAVVYPSFTAEPNAAPVRYPEEACACGQVATRRLYYRSADDKARPASSDPAVAMCDRCALRRMPELTRA